MPTGQFGKNHLGDRDEHLPTMHGFDEFFGNLYHLNAEEEPELPDYPKDPAFREKFGPRGVLHTWANPDGTQRIEDTGPLTKKRMETCDEEFRDAAVDFIKRQHEARRRSSCGSTQPTCTSAPTPNPRASAAPGAGSPSTTTRCSTTTTSSATARPARRTRPRREHDRHVLHRQRPAHEHLARRRHDAVPQREELELGGRLPCAGDGALARAHPGRHGLNGIVSHNDWFVTLLSAAGVPDIADKLRTGTDLGGTTYKVHLDGNDQLAYITGETDESPRQHFFYVYDDGGLTGLRFDNWKFVFLEQRCPGTLQIWAEPFTELRVPKLFNLRTDPYERADITSNTYWDWMADHMFLFVPAQAYVAQMLQTFVEFPQRQKSASFNLEQVMAKLQDGAAELS